MRPLFVISIALALGCSDRGLARLESVRDTVCKCKDPACGEAAMKRVAEIDVKASPRSRRIARDMMDCLARLYEVPPPDTGPDAEHAAESDHGAPPGHGSAAASDAEREDRPPSSAARQP